MLPIELSIITLNVWGIPIVSRDREARISAIVQELSTGRYDIVSLQEVWSQADCQVLREQTAAVLPYNYYFFSGVIGAGLMVLSKYPIVGTLFHAWSVNGYFHRVQHADWFGGKGVGLCKILIGEQLVHLYNAHLHAEYDNDNDEYKTHRVIQAFDTAQFIEATRGDSVLQILAGDLNTQPQDISYNLLLYTSMMRDCCQSDAILTNECARNSYTSKRALAKNPQGIRIDHIFLRSADHVDATVIEFSLPFPDRVPGQKYSFSDHEAIFVKLRVGPHKPAPFDSSDTCQAVALSDGTDARAGHAGSISDGQNSVMLSVLNGNYNPHCRAGSSPTISASLNSIVLKRIAVLNEAVTLCEAALEKLKVDRILYYSIAVFDLFLLIALVEYSLPVGSLKAVYLLLKFVLFGFVLYCLFMASIWNFMERNGVLSGKLSMQIMLRKDNSCANY